MKLSSEQIQEITKVPGATKPLRQKPNFDFVKSWFTSYLGQTTINGSNCANESAHNAYSQGATEFGVINSDDQIGVGNNGNGLDWDSFIDYFVHSRKAFYCCTTTASNFESSMEMSFGKPRDYFGWTPLDTILLLLFRNSIKDESCH